MESFSIKSIKVEIEIDQLQKFTFVDHAMSVKIEKVGLPDKNKAEVVIYGLALNTMEQLTTLSYNSLEYLHNSITIYAEHEGSFIQIYKGDIASAYADFSQAPEISFKIKAITGYIASLTALPPTSKKGIVLISRLLSELAIKGGFINITSALSALSLLSKNVENPYLTGSVVEQLIQLSHMVGLECILDDNEIISIPYNLSRISQKTFLSKENGLIHYPSFSNDGISARSIFNPHIVYASLVELSSIVPKASGVWKVTKLRHLLSANLNKNLSWETQFDAIRI